MRGGLTALERAKLEQARAAVQYARLTRSMYRPLPSAGVTPSREEMEAAKLRAATSRVGPDEARDRAMGMDPDVGPVQLRGPEGLSDLERAKLEAIRQGRPVPVPTPVATPSRRVPAPDAAASKTEKGGR
jgi:hypothetical protein